MCHLRRTRVVPALALGLLSVGSGCVPFFDYFGPAVPGGGPFVGTGDAGGGSGRDTGSSGGDSGGGGDSSGGGSVGYTLTAFADPLVPLVLRAQGSDGSSWSFYGRKDAGGAVVSLDRVVVQAPPPIGATGSELEMWFDELGRPVLIENAVAANAVNADLLAMFFDWSNATSPRVDVLQAGEPISSFRLNVPPPIGPLVSASEPPAEAPQRVRVTVEVRECGQLVTDAARIREVVVDLRRDGPGVRRIAEGNAGVFLADVEVPPNAIRGPQTQQTCPQDRFDADALCWGLRRVSDALRQACASGQTRGPCSIRRAVDLFVGGGCRFATGCGDVEAGQITPSGVLRVSADVWLSDGAWYRSANFSVPQGSDSARIIVELSNQPRAGEPAECGGTSGP